MITMMGKIFTKWCRLGMLVLPLAALFSISACDDADINKFLNGDTEITIGLDKEEAELSINETLQLTATVTPEIPEGGPKVMWSSSDEDVATVTTGDEVAVDGTYIPGGLVTAVGAGEAIITASIEGKEATCKITVKKAEGGETVAVTGIKLQSELHIKVGQSEQLTATVVPENAPDKTITWSSSDTKIATVENGKVTGIAAGTALVKAQAGGKEASCKVEVKEDSVPATSVVLSKTKLDLEIGQSETITAKVLPENATDKTVNWWCNNTEVATVDKGKITAVGAGACVVIAKCGDAEGPCVVTVASPGPTLELSDTEINLEVGAKKQITATVNPSNTQVYWSTSDSYTASVSKGLITGVGVGEAVITATAAGGQQVQCKVHVLEPTSEEVVDLGLSVKWRGWNLGATKPSEYGDYYAWGEVETYYNGLEYGQTWGVNVTTWKDGKSNGYNMVSYKFRKSGSLAYGTGDDHLIVTKYNTHEGNGDVDNKTVLDPEDDAAHVILGNGWRMPTKAEWQELLDNCDVVYLKRIGWMFKTETNPGLGVAAIKFTSKKNGKSIVFPLAGNIFNVDPRDCSTSGYYWSSTLVESFISDGNEWAPAEASMCYLHSATDYYVNHGYRSKGYSIRPVKD